MSGPITPTARRPTACCSRIASRRSVAAAVRGALRTSEIARANAKPDADLGAYDLTLRAMPYATALDAEAGSRALDLLDRALALDPDNALAVALAAWCHAQRVVYQFTDDPARESAQAMALGTRAVGLNGDATVLAILGNAFTAVHELDMADLVIRKALAADGGSAWAWSRSGWVDVYGGRPEAAIERFATLGRAGPERPARIQRLRRPRLRPFRCRPLRRHRPRDGAGAGRASLSRVGSPCALSGLCLSRSQAGSGAEPRGDAPALSGGDDRAGHWRDFRCPQAFRDRVANGLDTLGMAP